MNTTENVFLATAGTWNNQPAAVDQERADGRGLWSGKSLAELAEQYPDVRLVPQAEAIAIIEAAHRTKPMEISAEAFMDALEALPPMDWVRAGNGESFKFQEFYSGRITSIYARTGSTHWTFRDVATLNHAEIMGRIAQVLAADREVVA